jgi:hypothetical protein
LQLLFQETISRTVTLSTERLYCFNGLLQKAVEELVDFINFRLIQHTLTFFCQNVVTPVAETEQPMEILWLNLNILRKK